MTVDGPELSSNQRSDTLMQDRSPSTRQNLLATHGRTIHLDHKQTLHQVYVMSALPPKADVAKRGGDVRYVPKADIRRTVQPTRCLRPAW
jgi:hypothetical protein